MEKANVWIITEDSLDVTKDNGRYPMTNRGFVIAVCDTKETAIEFANKHIKGEMDLANRADDGFGGVNVYTENITADQVNTWVTYMKVTDQEDGKSFEYSIRITNWMVLGN